MSFYKKQRIAKKKFQAGGAITANSGWWDEGDINKNLLPSNEAPYRDKLAVVKKQPVSTVGTKGYSINPNMLSPNVYNSIKHLYKKTPDGFVLKNSVDIDRTPEETIEAVNTAYTSAKTPEDIAFIQRALKIKETGVWDEESVSAFKDAKRKVYLNTVEGRQKDLKVKSIQSKLGVVADGIWGPKTQAAFERAKEVQKNLGVAQDGVWGRKSQEAAKERIASRPMVSEGLSTVPGIDTKADTILTVEPVVKALSKKEIRQERRAERRAERKARREARRAERNGTEIKRSGGILY